jgi:hypothetical protein
MAVVPIGAVNHAVAPALTIIATFTIASAPNRRPP